ncbi:MAG: hypothetical protein U1F35_04260 [Steroidobacteraceae bacterium]
MRSDRLAFRGRTGRLAQHFTEQELAALIQQLQPLALEPNTCRSNQASRAFNSLIVWACERTSAESSPRLDTPLLLLVAGVCGEFITRWYHLACAKVRSKLQALRVHRRQRIALAHASDFKPFQQ